MKKLILLALLAISATAYSQEAYSELRRKASATVSDPKTNTLVTWICSWIGGLMALFGIIWAAINQASHNSEGRNQGIIVGAIGIVVAFAPQITNMILGK